jgi:hypothetical protein
MDWEYDKWEHTIAHKDWNTNPSATRQDEINLLNTYGLDGWMLCSAVITPQMSVYYFRRPVR